MGSFITETSVRNVLLERLADGEKLDAVARGIDMLGRPHYVGRTDRRGIVLRLSKSFEPRDEESIPLKKLDKKLTRMALGKGLWLSPPGELHFTTDKEKALFAAEKEALEEHLDDDAGDGEGPRHLQDPFLLPGVHRQAPADGQAQGRPRDR
jgi:hypothetical protein